MEKEYVLLLWKQKTELRSFGSDRKHGE